eukprot:2864518-Karenia_brevis.AAC.1
MGGRCSSQHKAGQMPYNCQGSLGHRACQYCHADDWHITKMGWGKCREGVDHFTMGFGPCTQSLVYG